MTEDYGDITLGLLSAFGTNANTRQRQAEERRAMLSPSDKRRKRGPKRDIQFNPRISAHTRDLIAKLQAKEGGSQADLVERMTEAYARAKGIV